MGYIKLERFLPKNQHTQRKFLNFDNRTNGEPQQLVQILKNELEFQIWNQNSKTGFGRIEIQNISSHKKCCQILERMFLWYSSTHNKHTVYTRSGRGATEIPTMEMPGVPSYDNSERQLLASLEQELGVLQVQKKYFG